LWHLYVSLFAIGLSKSRHNQTHQRNLPAPQLERLFYYLAVVVKMKGSLEIVNSHDAETQIMALHDLHILQKRHSEAEHEWAQNESALYGEIVQLRSTNTKLCDENGELIPEMQDVLKELDDVKMSVRSLTEDNIFLEHQLELVSVERDAIAEQFHEKEDGFFSAEEVKEHMASASKAQKTKTALAMVEEKKALHYLELEREENDNLRAEIQRLRRILQTSEGGGREEQEKNVAGSVRARRLVLLDHEVATSTKSPASSGYGNLRRTKQRAGSRQVGKLMRSCSNAVSFFTESSSLDEKEQTGARALADNRFLLKRPCGKFRRSLSVDHRQSSNVSAPQDEENRHGYVDDNGFISLSQRNVLNGVADSANDYSDYIVGETIVDFNPVARGIRLGICEHTSLERVKDHSEKGQHVFNNFNLNGGKTVMEHTLPVAPKAGVPCLKKCFSGARAYAA
jgi:hypothetical protein